MENSKLIIIEGPQGVGKSSLTTYLRETLPNCDLYRLSGIKDKTITGLEKSRKRFFSLLSYLKEQETVGLNEVFDRTFMSDFVYANLGYKEYDFTDTFYELAKLLNDLNFDIHYFSLYLEDVNQYKKRLQRDNHHTYQSFSLENSINQQNEYMKVAEILERYPNIHVHKIPNDDFDSSYAKINEILGISKNAETKKS